MVIKAYTRVLLFIALFGISVVSCSQQRMEETLAGYTDFSVASGRYLAAQNSSNNLFFSPLSLVSALGMVSLGAAGDTLAEIRQMLGAVPATTIEACAQEVLARNGKNCELTSANAVWVDSRSELQPLFEQNVATFYNGTAQTLDFSRADSAAKVINDWCAAQTRGKIKEVVKPGDVALADCILTNAVYFKGLWENKFHKENTYEELFTTKTGDRVMVPMMHQREEYWYAETASLRMLELPYAQTDLVMDLVLAKDPASSYADFTTHDLQQLCSNSYVATVNLSLPKFTCTTSYEMNGLLQHMGMRKAFDQYEADFSGILKNLDAIERLYISKVIQKAFVEVSEEGTEAAAVTAVIMCKEAMCSYREPINFVLDRPFMFFIRDTKTGLILFSGIINNPLEA